MRNIVDKPNVLALNANWLPIGVRSVGQAIVAMNSQGDDKAAVALDIQYKQNEDGSYDFSAPLAMIPTKWEDWINLPILPHHDAIHTAHLAIRVPTVVISTHYHKMPNKTFRPSKKTIYERDKGICQYTGKKVSYNSATLDHVQPKSKGGKDSFENLVTCAPDVNFKKGNKSNKEAGLKLLKKPVAPLPVPVMALITEARIADWQWFIVKKIKQGYSL